MATQSIIERDHRPIELGDHTHSESVSFASVAVSPANPPVAPVESRVFPEYDAHVMGINPPGVNRP